MDTTLLEFIQNRLSGTSDSRSDRHEERREDRWEALQKDLLERLIVEEAAPLVRRTIRHRLHFYLSERGTSPSNPDAEDLYHDILTRLVGALNRLVGSETPPNIQDFRQYVMRVAVNGCNDYLRSRYPRRTRLRDRIRDQLERQPEFGLWRSGRDEFFCGLTRWRDRPPVSREILHRRMEAVEFNHLLSGKRSRQLRLILREIFTLIDGPVDLDTIVGIVAERLGITEDRYQSLDAPPGRPELSGAEVLIVGRNAEGADESYQSRSTGRTSRAALARGQGEDGAVGLERHLDERVALRRMWEIWTTLPPRPRETFFYSFSTSRGEDMLTLLFQAGVATPREVARVLDIPLEGLMERWREMPMRNVDLAARWGVERQQVNKWRFQALKMIEKRLL